jgi:hypothetical protein
MYVTCILLKRGLFFILGTALLNGVGDTAGSETHNPTQNGKEDTVEMVDENVQGNQSRECSEVHVSFRIK